MNKKDALHFKAKLEKEKKLLEEELGTVAKVNPDNPEHWDATPAIEVDSADENEVADRMEELEGNEAIIEQLEPQLKEVNAALARIEAGTYGNCEVSGEAIEPERLEANPSARTCIAHMNDKLS
ncbi:MAG: TraR/DksA C4-type zinc finger protein [Patescibacteria group bacterium]